MADDVMKDARYFARLSERLLSVESTDEEGLAVCAAQAQAYATLALYHLLAEHYSR